MVLDGGDHHHDGEALQTPTPSAKCSLSPYDEAASNSDSDDGNTNDYNNLNIFHTAVTKKSRNEMDDRATVTPEPSATSRSSVHGSDSAPRYSDSDADSESDSDASGDDSASLTSARAWRIVRRPVRDDEMGIVEGFHVAGLVFVMLVPALQMSAGAMLRVTGESTVGG